MEPQRFPKTVTLGYSPCPNDTFIFYALVHRKIDTGDLRFREMLLDVETLNQKALHSELNMTKVSFHAYAYLRDRYVLLRSGGALGRGCGPLIVAKNNLKKDSLKGKRIAIPGKLTTAYLLLQLYEPLLAGNVEVMPFDSIMDAVRTGTVDAGLIIHESRFTYPEYGLSGILDLGKWWEDETGLPIPLGCIIAEKSLGPDLIATIEVLVRRSVEYAFAHRDNTKEYIKVHSQELADSVIEQHINLYVNNYSLDLGDDGLRAVGELLKRAEQGRILRGSNNAVVR
ncbi:MAG TPA: 1,4-dihydroxy-6-naphthoate synthase [Thermodesulfovibrionales bacterium]|nr:1,4-dihydroxy-6-naphthoate synthase [Thermodesulfovibrionales bacterium]